MRHLLAAAGAAICVIGLFGATSCKGGDQGGGEPAAVVEQSSELADQQESLIARRDALLKSRRSIAAERQELQKKRLEVVAAGGDTTAIDKRASELDAEEEELGAREDELNSRLDALDDERRSLIAALAEMSASDDGKMAAREASVAARESTLAARERRIADREALLADRERALAAREKNMCSAAPARTIIQTVDVKGSQYTKSDVEPLLKRARRSMSRRGVLQADLPPPAQELEREATRAMAEGDYGRARFAATQLLATVNATKIDKAFVAAKIGRLNALMKGKSLSGDAQKQVDELFRDATANYGDGRFDAANKRLNRIYALVR